MPIERLLALSPLIGMGLLLAAWVMPASSTPVRADEMTPPPPPPAKPAQGLDVADDAALHRLLAEAPDGSTLRLAPGRYTGPLLIDRGLTLWGPEDAVVATTGEGTTVRLRGNGSAALGFTIEGSGTRFDLLDAALELHGEGLRAEGLHIRGAVFGIIANQCRDITLHGNDVTGTGQEAMGLRGDGIRIWETYDSEVSDNRLRAARDVVVWYSSRNRIQRNQVHGCRYGTHLMYSHENEVRDNSYIGNVVGLFLMYSREVLVQGNVFADSGGSAGIGLGMKESSDLHLVDNLFLGDERGLYFDNSPFEAGSVIEVRSNEFRFSTIALAFHESPHDVIIEANVFRDNRSLVTVSGGGDALDAVVSGNTFGGYRGYDLDGDGVGDIPFEERSVSEQLFSNHPSLALFRGTPAAGMLEAVGRLLPLYGPKPLLRDERPAM